MQTLNVFIDTSIFRNKSFDLSKGGLQRLEELGREGEVYIYSTSITERECVRRLEQLLDEDTKAISRLNIHLENSSHQPIDLNELKEVRMRGWKAYLDESQTQIIPIYNLAVENVFDRYFKSEPPFTKEKKCEFPDAFVLTTLKAWCDEHKKNIYVVSSDKPFLECCDGTQLIQIDSLEKFLDLYSQHKAKNLYEFAEHCFEYLKEAINEQIKEEFQDRQFTMPEFWDADVEVKVNTVELRHPFFTNIDPDLSIMDVDLDVDLSLSVSFSYEDPDMTYWDSEAREAVSLEQIDDFANAKITIKVAVEIAFEEMLEPSLAELQLIRLPDKIEIHTSSHITGRHIFTSTD